MWDFGDCIFGDCEGKSTLRIKPQVVLGDYRADFLLKAQLIEETSDGIFIFEKQLIVECDGFEFHDRTREQAISDRSRDRKLQALGYHLFRFAGAEVWADACACAEEAVAFVRSSIYAQRGAFWVRKQAARERIHEPKRTASA